jgi:hypothetical protein
MSKHEKLYLMFPDGFLNEIIRDCGDISILVMGHLYSFFQGEHKRGWKVSVCRLAEKFGCSVDKMQLAIDILRRGNLITVSEDGAMVTGIDYETVELRCDGRL